jgi:hypothetical protein
MQLRSIQAPLATAVRAAATFGMLLAMTGTARAAEQDFRGEVTPFAGYRFGGEFRVADSDRDLELEDSASFGMMLDLYARGGTSYQLHYSLQQTDARFDDPVEGTTSFDTTLHFLQFGGTYRGDGETFQPYLAATLGATHLRTAGAGGGSDTFPSGSIGAGVNVRPTHRFGMRLEGRVYGTLTDSNTALFCRTGPDQNVCAIRVEGALLAQYEAFAGFTFRF